MTEEAEALEQDQFMDQVNKATEQLPGYPSQDTINTWKLKHGEVHVSALSDTEIFLYRPISRSEHKGLQVASPDVDTYHEKLVGLCVLYSSVPNLESKAGFIGTLAEQISQSSYFVPPQIVGTLTRKL